MRCRSSLLTIVLYISRLLVKNNQLEILQIWGESSKSLVDQMVNNKFQSLFEKEIYRELAEIRYRYYYLSSELLGLIHTDQFWSVP